jgi:hypothetical protein
MTRCISLLVMPLVWGAALFLPTKAFPVSCYDNLMSEIFTSGLQPRLKVP